MILLQLLALPLISASALPQLSDLLSGLTGGSNSKPQTTLDYATFQGTQGVAAVPNIDSFLGMPFAKAGRLENPRVMGSEDNLNGVQDASQYGLSCPQQQLIASPLAVQNGAVGGLLAAVEQLAFGGVENQGEECLSINVQRPEGVNSTAGLPVLFWIHGGGFELGSSAALGSETTAVQGVIYQGARLVARSVEMGQPIIFVSANHRLNFFGAMSSQELNDAGVANLLLKDQRAAMEWIQKYIGEFGGDKKRVTLYGESAGSLAIATHMVLNDGDPEGLFSSAIMASGGIMKLYDYKQEQGTFDFLAECSGCGSGDKVACLRKADYNKIYNCVQQVPNFFSCTSTKVPWYPRPDGTYLVDSPHRLLRQGKVAKIPYIIGDMKDEGTLFSAVPQLNITNNADFKDFWQKIYFQHITPDQVSALTDMYSQNPADGSPYDTGILNAIGPQYKRLASLVGDITFEAGRRDLLNHTSATHKAYTYQIEQSIPLLGQLPLLGGLNALTNLPVLGSFHVSDVVLNSFGLLPPALSRNSRDIMSTYISFVNFEDPNRHGLSGVPSWPRWTPEGREMFRFRESGPDIVRDDYREAQMAVINKGDGDLYRY